jgi:hypothetical protein
MPTASAAAAAAAVGGVCRTMAWMTVVTTKVYKMARAAIPARHRPPGYFGSYGRGSPAA